MPEGKVEVARCTPPRLSTTSTADGVEETADQLRSACDPRFHRSLFPRRGQPDGACESTGLLWPWSHSSRFAVIALAHVRGDHRLFALDADFGAIRGHCSLKLFDYREAP